MNVSEKIVILLDSFSRAEAQEALNAYSGGGNDATRVVVAPITDLMAEQKTADAVDAVVSKNWMGGTAHKDGKRGALIAGATQSEAITLMRCFKSVIPADSDPAFALVTKTGMGWKVGKYLAHIRKEHNFMKNADPSMDPDMKIVE